ncbi:MAG TPA: 5-formyltetrahydrofolate cyclo-ligase [Gammaproteobacteria bacterium]
MTTELDRNTIRRLVRARRRELSGHERSRRSAQLACNITRSALFRNCRTLAIYLPNDGEVDLTAVAQSAWSQGKQCFLPVLSPLYHNRLWFAPYTPQTTLVLNRFGIPEPALNWHAMRPVWSLDLLLMPLVAFDGWGNRLGMGGGFYDRTLAYLEQRSQWRKPHLVGTAFELQHFDAVPSQPWDVPLEAVVTEQQYHRFERNSHKGKDRLKPDEGQ